MTEPTLVTTPPKSRFIPELRSPWWAVLLVLSLMANLVIGGAAIGARMKGGGWQMALMENRAQLLPRKFFAELPHERRRELMDMFKAKKDQFAQGREAADAISLKFAELLEQPDFDQIKIKAVINDFTSGVTSFATQGQDVILDIVAKLTPDERKNLAANIRERAARRGK